jgi:hypothetical protein
MPQPPKRTNPDPTRIRLSEAIRLLGGVLTRSEFYEHYRYDPEIVRRLDIREHPTKARALHCDRAAVLEWLDELVRGHPLALGRDPNADNLGEHSRPTRSADEDSFGARLAALCLALSEGAITKTEFERAKADLEGR